MEPAQLPKYTLIETAELARLRAEVAMLRAQVRTRVWRGAIAAAWGETLAHHRSTLTRRCL